MKKLFLLMLLCVANVMALFADEWTDANGITWNYYDENGGVTLCGASGYGDSFSIPSKINGKDIVKISDYAFEDCTALKSIGDLDKCTHIGQWAFGRCNNLNLVGNISSCTTLGNYAFAGCSNLSDIDLNSCTRIGTGAFQECSKILEISLPSCIYLGHDAFRQCQNLQAISNLENCTFIGENAFSECRMLQSIGDLTNCEQIGAYAFRYCNQLEEIGDMPSCISIGDCAFDTCRKLKKVGNLDKCTSIGIAAFQLCERLQSIGPLKVCSSIGDNAFYGCRSLTELHVGNLIPPLLGKNVFDIYVDGVHPSPTTIIVPQSSITDYRTAENWSDVAHRIISDDSEIDYTGANKILVSALDNASGLQVAIGDSDLQNVMSLEIEGDINGYDIMILRNKMPNLHFLDLTNANIVSNSYNYYGNFHTSANKMNGYEFYQQYKLVEVKLPKTITYIGEYSFADCYGLKKVDMFNGINNIADRAFSKTFISQINLPEGVESIGPSAFDDCEMLERVSFPSTLKVIDYYAFDRCMLLNEVVLPEGLQRIKYQAFRACNALNSITIPSSVISIEDEAFKLCPSLKTIKTKLVDPFRIGQNTFDTWSTATLYVPMTDEWKDTYNKYYWDTQWSQFSRIIGWDPTIDNFHIDNDYLLNEGHIGEKPDADINDMAGFIVGEEAYQKIDEIHVKHNGSTSGSLIGDETNLEADKLFCDIQVTANRWYFFAFPFDVKRSDIEAPGNWVFRYYDGKERAENARGGWKNLPKDQEYLEAGVGYIFQTNKSGTLVIPVENPDFTADGKSPQLNVHASENAQDASWNFVGNPYLSYYDVADITDFTSPITVWNGSSYEAVSPEDDDYILQPYQAFFVQKPTQKEIVGFNKDGRTTYRKSQVKNANARARRAKSAVNPERLIVNLTVTDGENTDKTRVVFNDNASMGYDMERDAAKFMSTESVPQLYTLNGNVQYAINERPNGSREVKLGFTANADGTFTIAAVRMDTPMLLKDIETGIITDLAETSYSFSAAAGTYNNRFYLINNAEVDGIANVENLTVGDVTYYDLSGKRIKKAGRGVVIANNKKVIAE